MIGTDLKVSIIHQSECINDRIVEGYLILCACVMYLLLIDLGWYTTPLANLPYYCCNNNSCNSYHDDNNNNYHCCNYWRSVVGRQGCIRRRWRGVGPSQQHSFSSCWGVGALWITGRSKHHWAVSIDTMTLAPHPLTQASIREMRELLPVAEVPSSLARCVRNDGDSSKQENDFSSNVSLLHSAHPVFNICTILVSMSFCFCSVRVAWGSHNANL